MFNLPNEFLLQSWLAVCLWARPFLLFWLQISHLKRTKCPLRFLLSPWWFNVLTYICTCTYNNKELIQGKVNKHFRKSDLKQNWAFELSLILLNRLTSSCWKCNIKSRKTCDRALTLPHLIPDAPGLSYLILYTVCLSLEIILWVKNKKWNVLKQFPLF